MAQIFHRSTNLISRLSIFGGAFFVAVLAYALYEIALSPWYTGQHMKLQQPVPFSHRHHAGELGIDCRYCHTSVEKSSFAGVPPTQTCMTCHSQIWTNASMLEPVRASYRDDTSLEWQRVNSLPDFVYFDHSIHVNKGVGCETCHGRVDQMPLTWKAQDLHMSWCLGCHRHPENFLRPKERVFAMGWEPPGDQRTLGRQLMREYHIEPAFKLTNCSICHR